MTEEAEFEGPPEHRAEGLAVDPDVSENEVERPDDPPEDPGIRTTKSGGRTRYACAYGCPRAYFERELLERQQAHCAQCKQRKET